MGTPKPINLPTFQYLFAYGALSGSIHQGSVSALVDHLRDNFGGREVLPRLWLLESNKSAKEVEADLFGTTLGRVGSALLCEIPNGVYAQGLPGVLGKFLVRP